MGHYETGRTGESLYITPPPDDDLFYTTERFVLSLMHTLLRFHCLLFVTACNFKLFQYEYVVISHALRSTNSVYTDPLYYHSITLILRRSRSGTVWFYTSTSNKRAARPKLYTKSLTRDLKRMYSCLTLVRISINL